jgi:hypothetical protein
LTTMVIMNPATVGGPPHSSSPTINEKGNEPKHEDRDHIRTNPCFKELSNR